MKKINLKRCRLAVIAILLLSCIFVLAACGDSGSGAGSNDGGNVAGGNSGVTSIAIADNDKPQVVYAEGQAFNAAKGSLNVVYDSGKKETIALNAEGVQITGYDANKLGEQSLVVSYGGKSISLTVEVAKRMTFSGYENNYFINSEFNTQKGKVVIVTDNGDKLSVRLNDESISVVSFDSATAGTDKPVTIRYSKNGVEFTDTVAVNVYGIGKVSFTKPNKTAYGSHDTALKLDGGYLTVTADGNESMTQRVPLEQSMVSGFDPSVATRENVENSIEQTITVTYAGNTYNFNIMLHYSGVSIVNDAIELLKDIEFDVNDLKITEEQAIAVMEAMMAYVDMVPSDRDLLDEQQVLKVAKFCAIVSRENANGIAAYVAEAVTIKDGNVGLRIDSTYAAVEEAVMFLSDPNCALIQVYDFMESFVELFGDVVLATTEDGTEVTIAQYDRIVTRDTIAQVANVLEVMLQAYDYLDVVPEDWTVEMLAQYGEPVLSAVYDLSTFVSSKMITSVCHIISQWRTNDDYLEIIYTYYYHYDRGMMQEELFSSIPFPLPIRELYSYVSTANRICQQVYQAGASALWADVSEFYLYYNLAVEKAEEVKNHENQLYRDLYAFINFEQLMDAYVKYAPSGVVDMMEGAYNDSEIEALMQTYVDLLVIVNANGGALTFDDQQELLQSIFDQLVALSPAKQQAFLGCLYNMYGDVVVKGNMLMTYSEQNTTGAIFTYLLHEYFRYFLPETTHTIVRDLMLAMEYLMNSTMYEDAMENFRLRMESVNAAYSALSTDDKLAFQKYAGVAYNKYNALYQLDKNGSDVDSELYINLFSELMQTIRDFETLQNNLVDEETSTFNPGMMGAMMSAYARAEQLVEQLKALDNEQIMALYYLLEMDYNEGTKISLDVLWMRVRDAFLQNSHMMHITLTYSDGREVIMYAYDYYHETNVSTLGAAAYYVVMQQYNGSTQFDAEKVMNAMKTFWSMDLDSIYVFYLLDFDLYYYDALQTFFNEVLTGTNEAFATKLLEAERACCEYLMSQSNEDKRNAFFSIMEELIAMRETITDTEAFDTYLAEMYAFYLVNYNAAKEALQ